MERKQILEMPAGRELDALVAEHVIGWVELAVEPDPTDNRTVGGKLFSPPGMPWDSGSLNAVPQYSTDIACAWQVVETMVNNGEVFIVKGDGLRRGDFNPRWTVLAQNMPRVDNASAPLAICQAALIAVLKLASQTPL